MTMKGVIVPVAVCVGVLVIVGVGPVGVRVGVGSVPVGVDVWVDVVVAVLVVVGELVTVAVWVAVAVEVAVGVGVRGWYSLNTRGSDTGVLTVICNNPRLGAAWEVEGEDRISHPARMVISRAIPSHFQIGFSLRIIAKPSRLFMVLSIRGFSMVSARFPQL
jgi:hypothetical protein